VLGFPGHETLSTYSPVTIEVESLLRIQSTVYVCVRAIYSKQTFALLSRAKDMINSLPRFLLFAKRMLILRLNMIDKQNKFPQIV
jgi:hypothetical protein